MNLYARFMTWLGADSLSPGEDVRYSRRAFLRESWRILRWFLILPILWIIWYVLEALFEGRDTTIAMLQFFIVITALLMVVLLCRAVLVWSYNHLSPTTKVIVRGIGEIVNAVLFITTGAVLWHLYVVQEFGKLWLSLPFVIGWLIQIFRESLKKNQEL